MKGASLFKTCWAEETKLKTCDWDTWLWPAVSLRKERKWLGYLTDLLYLTCCIWPAVSDLLYLTCCIWPAVSDLLWVWWRKASDWDTWLGPAVSDLLYLTCCIWPAVGSRKESEWLGLPDWPAVGSRKEWKWLGYLTLTCCIWPADSDLLWVWGRRASDLGYLTLTRCGFEEGERVTWATWLWPAVCSRKESEWLGLPDSAVSWGPLWRRWIRWETCSAAGSWSCGWGDAASTAVLVALGPTLPAQRTQPPVHTRFMHLQSRLQTRRLHTGTFNVDPQRDILFSFVLKLECFQKSVHIIDQRQN